MKIEFQRLTLRLRHPWRIARERTQETKEVLLVRVGNGFGEIVPSPFYGETTETATVVLQHYAEELGDLPDEAPIQAVLSRLDRGLRGHPAARAGLEMALWDQLGRRANLPLWRLWGVDPARMPVTSFTIGLDTPERMQQKAREAPEGTVLKVKLGTEEDLEIVRSLRDVTDRPIRVDANTAWTPQEAVRKIEALERLGVELIEQPVAAEDREGLRYVRERSPLPILADESAPNADAVPDLVGAADGVNVKLNKCGGLLEALRMIHVARTHRLRVMVGCMIQTSIGIAAAAQLAPLADWVDLDGNLHVLNDPFQGPRLEAGRLLLTEAPGLGVRYRSGT
ncbi:MAG: dipeptide epimerase [Candidatus Poribacteria bacterium]|nr:MAG: dipeptide epimerase [Candidatus Poribacteria bacterium]